MTKGDTMTKPCGVVRVMELEEKGYAYIRP